VGKTEAWLRCAAMLSGAIPSKLRFRPRSFTLCLLMNLLTLTVSFVVQAI